MNKEETKEQIIKVVEYPTAWSINQLANLLGMTRQTVSNRLKRAGVPYDPKDPKAKLYNIQAAMAGIFGQSVAPTAGGEENLQGEAREKFLTAKAKRELVEIQLAEKKKEVVKMDDVLKAVDKEYSTIRSLFLGLPTKLARHLANEVDPETVNEILEKSIQEVFEALQADAQSTLENMTDEQPEEQIEDGESGE